MICQVCGLPTEICMCEELSKERMEQKKEILRKRNLSGNEELSYFQALNPPMSCPVCKKGLLWFNPRNKVIKCAHCKCIWELKG